MDELKEKISDVLGDIENDDRVRISFNVDSGSKITTITCKQIKSHFSFVDENDGQEYAFHWNGETWEFSGGDVNNLKLIEEED
jgi:hypothetical protein